MVDDGSPGLERGPDVDRIVFFSDAIFAIAMTLLAISLRLPVDTKDSDVAHELHNTIPSIYAYMLSFAAIGVYWLAHHRMFHFIRAFDGTLIVLNLATLCVVAFVPFPTTVLGDHGKTTAGVVFYATTIGLLGVAMESTWMYAARGYRLIRPDTSADYLRYSMLRGMIPPAVFFASIPIAFASPSAAEFFWILILVANIVLRRRYGSTYKHLMSPRG
jgi:uncharacterized membrane protein